MSAESWAIVLGCVVVGVTILTLVIDGRAR